MLGVFDRPIGIVDQPVEKFVVPLFVDQPGARTLKLMAHAARAPDMHVDLLGIAHDRTADRAAEREAAGA